MPSPIANHPPLEAPEAQAFVRMANENPKKRGTIKLRYTAEDIRGNGRGIKTVPERVLRKKSTRMQYLKEKSKRVPLSVGIDVATEPFSCGDEDLRRNAFSHIFPNLESDKHTPRQDKQYL